VIEGYNEYYGNLEEGSSNSITNMKTEAEFVRSLYEFVYETEIGRFYVRDVRFGTNGTTLDAFQIKTQYVALTKTKKKGGSNSDDVIIDDADRQIEAMDETRRMVKEDWSNDESLPSNRFVYSEKYLAIEGFKVIRRELFVNVGLAILAVTVLVLITVASPLTSFFVALSVAFCLVEILGFMYALDIAIDSVSVINLVLTVGLSVDYSAHVGHCFMTKHGK